MRVLLYPSTQRFHLASIWLTCCRTSFISESHGSFGFWKFWSYFYKLATKIFLAKYPMKTVICLSKTAQKSPNFELIKCNFSFILTCPLETYHWLRSSPVFWPWPNFLTTQKLVNPAPCCSEDMVLARSSERTLLAFASLAHCEVLPRYRSPAKPQFYSWHLASS